MLAEIEKKELEKARERQEQMRVRAEVDKERRMKNYKER